MAMAAEADGQVLELVGTMRAALRPEKRYSRKATVIYSLGTTTYAMSAMRRERAQTGVRSISTDPNRDNSPVNAPSRRKQRLLPHAGPAG